MLYAGLRRIMPGHKLTSRKSCGTSIKGHNMKIRILTAAGLVASMLTAQVAIAAEKEAPDEKAVAAEVGPAKSFTTSHSGRFGGQTVKYSVTAGETYLTDKDGNVNGSIFSFAYVADDADSATRPVAFVWNGGPGSASVWLHMGTLGPVRVVVPSNAEDAGAPPYPMQHNAESILDIADLVFVDPVGTGFSRPLGESDGKEFWGTNEDTASMVQFIRRWITDNGRWNSPKYLIGESFGTTRNAAVAGALEGDKPAISLNGVIMISQAMDYTGSTPSDDNLVAFVTYFPTMAATAAYHGKVALPDGDLEAFLHDARAYAVDELLPALFKGSALIEDERQRIAARYAAFTGLDVDYVLRADLRVKADRFRKELLRDQGLSVGRLDGRYTGDDIDDTADEAEGDASGFAIGSAYTAAINSYMRDKLNVSVDRAYKVSGDVGKDWNYRPVPEGKYWEPTDLNTARELSHALRRNKDLKVLIASGYYDYATPFFDAEYTFGRHGILKNRLTFTYYPAGHMMYLHDPSRVEVLQDIREFIEAR